MNRIGPGRPVAETPPGIPARVFTQIAGKIRDGICVQDIYGRIEWMNPVCEDMFGWPLKELQGRLGQDFIVPPDKQTPTPQSPRFVYDLGSSIFDQNPIREFRRRDGSRFWNQQSFAVLDLGPGSEQKKIVITCRDVTEQVETERQLRQLRDDLEHAANHDDLTGLANRKKLKSYLGSGPVLSAIAKGQIGILQLDIDKFKEINNSLDHNAGDAVLRHVAAALSASAGPGDLVCRNGGDEFLLVCLHPGGAKALNARALALLEQVKIPVQWKDQALSVRASIGTSLADTPGTTGETLIAQADLALYNSKAEGGARMTYYTPDLSRRRRNLRKRMRELKTGLFENQFEMHLQPQLHLPTSRVTGCEALIRWNHPSLGLLSPAKFLSVAEQAGLAAELDYMSMNLALDALVWLRETGFPKLSMSINVSSAILADVNYPGLLDWALQSRDIDPGRICIEILETTILQGGDLEVATALDRLKRLGVRVALDDFGTGFAGLAHLSAFEVDEIKLDLSMISRLASDPRNRMIVRSIIHLSGLLGIDVVAEGVETNEQLEILRRAKCPKIQGFGLARPMPVAETLDWLGDNLSLPMPIAFADRPTADVVRLPGAGD